MATKRKYIYKEGDIINNLTFLEEIPNIRPFKGKFICYCGKEFTTRIIEVRQGRTKSCGCWHKTGNYRIQHGDSIKTSKHNYLFGLWLNIKRRCYNENYPRYSDWGGRGIKMYEPWANNYLLFKKWLITNIGERPTVKHIIDRIDNNGNYESGNLRWQTPLESAKNRRKKNFNKCLT